MKSLIGDITNPLGEFENCIGLEAFHVEVGDVLAETFRVFEPPDILYDSNYTHPELVQARRWKFCDLPGEWLYTAHPDYAAHRHYALNLETRQIRPVEGLPEGGYALVDGWVARDPYREEGDGLRIGPSVSVFVNLETGEERTEGPGVRIKIEADCGGGRVIVQCDDEINKVNSVQMIDLHTGDRIWSHSPKSRFIGLAGNWLRVGLVGEKLYYGENESIKGLWSIDNGALVYCSSEEGRRIGIYQIEGDLVRGQCYPSLNLFEYNIETGDEQIWENEKGIVGNIYGDYILKHDRDNKRLIKYAYKEDRIVFDKPFDPARWLGKKSENPEDLHCWVSIGNDVHPAGEGFVFTTDEWWGLRNSPYTRVNYFEPDELDQDEVTVEREEMAAQQERVERADGDSEYRIWFDEPQPLFRLLTHTRVVAGAVLETFGRNYTIGRKIDRHWSGTIRVDLRNQDIADEERVWFDRLAISFNSHYDWQYSAGTDLDDKAKLEFDYGD